ncbi:MAG: type VI secretion system-associated protein TagF [Sandaracinaceae bacterium]
MSELGLFGKVPTRDDFVRHPVSGDAARSFERWMEAALDALPGVAGRLPPSPVRAVVHPPGADHSVVAAIVPSRDQAGRPHPLTVLALVPRAEVVAAFPLVPMTYATFLDQAVSLALRGASDLAYDDLARGLDVLTLPAPLERRHAQDLGEQVLAHPMVPEIHGRLFGASGQAPYAYQTLLTACRDAAQEAGEAPVLDCPVRVDVDLFHWLELTRRVVPAPPAFFWVEDPSPRLLLALGEPPPAILGLLADPTVEHPRLWPLTTDRTAALAAARTALSPVLGPLGPDAPLSGYYDALAQRAAAGSLR